MRTEHLRRLLSGRDGEAGQGLIELIVALTLLAIAIGALLTVASSSAISLQRSDQKGTALMLAEQQIELYRNLTYDHIELDATSVANTDTIYNNAHASDPTIPQGGVANEVTDTATPRFCTPYPNAEDWCNPSRIVASGTSPDHRNYRVDTYIVPYAVAGGVTIKQVSVVVRDLHVSGDPILARASSTFSKVDSASAKAQPKLLVLAPAAGNTGGTLTPSATLSGGSNPTGNITWFVIGPLSTAPASCSSGSGGLTWQQVGSSATVTGNGGYTDGTAYGVSVAGTYWWYATYDGDAVNNGVNSGCSATMTHTVVTNNQVATTLHLTQVPATATKGHALTAASISAQISGGNSPAGTITFFISQSPGSQPACPGGAWTSVGTATVSGTGTYSPSSVTYTPSATGTYYWYASYDGNPTNAPSNTCSDAASTTVVGNETFSVTLGTTSPWTAGTAFSMTVKALLSGGATDTAYAGSKTLVLSGAGTSPDGHTLNYPASVTFTNGQATFSATDYKAETATVQVLDGTLNISGNTPTFTVKAGSAAKLAWSTATTNKGSLSSPCYFTCTWTNAGNGNQFSVTVSVTDAYGNIVSNIGNGQSVAFTQTAGGWTSASLTLPSSGLATTGSNAWNSPNGNWAPASATASYSGFSATVSASK
jgi:type II secretory pathway pseudopilin PulG